MIKIKSIILTLLAVLVTAMGLSAQEKSDWYYADHTSEILPDAKALFAKGTYNRAIELCNLHRDWLGTDHAETDEVDALAALVLKCQKLATDLENYAEDGYSQLAKAVAEELSTYNPSDERLKAFGLWKPASEPAGTQALQVAETPEPQTGEEQEPGVVQQTLARTEQNAPAQKEREVPARDDGDDDSLSGMLSYMQNPRLDYETSIIVKGGITYFQGGGDIKSFAPGISLGAYDIGGSRLGAEACLYKSFSSYQDVSAFGVNLMAVLRVGKFIYPSIGVGFISCRSEGNTATQCMNVPMEISFLIGNHFLVSASIGYFPQIFVWRSTEATTSGLNYSIYDRFHFNEATLVPSIRVGYAF